MAEKKSSVRTMWQKFLGTGKISEDTPYSSWQFGADEKTATELVELVIEGKKKATASLHKIYKYIDEELPRAGDYSVITDGKGQAGCIIKTTEVNIVPFNLVSEEFARKEGEGDKTLDYWRKVHRKFFSMDLEEIAGEKFSDEMLVVCEEFELVFTG